MPGSLSPRIVFQRVTGAAAEVQEPDRRRLGAGDHAQHHGMAQLGILGPCPVDPAMVVAVKRQATVIVPGRNGSSVSESRPSPGPPRPAKRSATLTRIRRWNMFDRLLGDGRIPRESIRLHPASEPTADLARRPFMRRRALRTWPRTGCDSNRSRCSRRRWHSSHIRRSLSWARLISSRASVS